MSTCLFSKQYAFLCSAISSALFLLFGCAETNVVRTVDIPDDAVAIVNSVAMHPIHDLIALPDGWEYDELSLATQLPNEAWVVANSSTGEVVYIDNEQATTIVSFGLGPNELETVNDILVDENRFYIADYDWNIVLLEFDMRGVWQSRINLGTGGLSDAIVHRGTLYGIKDYPYGGVGLGFTDGFVLFAADISQEEPELIWESLDIATIHWTQTDSEQLVDRRSIAHVEVTEAGLVFSNGSVYYVNFPNYHIIQLEGDTGSITDQFKIVDPDSEPGPTFVMVDKNNSRHRSLVTSVVSPLNEGTIYVFREPQFEDSSSERSPEHLRSRVDLFSPQFDYIDSVWIDAVFMNAPSRMPLITGMDPFTRVVQAALIPSDVSEAIRGHLE